MNYILEILSNELTTTIILPLVFGTVLIVMGVYGRDKTRFFEQSGIETEGIVFDAPDKFSAGNDSSRKKVVIRFVTHDKVWITGEPTISAISYGIGGIKNGDKVKVIYNPENPNDFAINNSRMKIASKVFLILGLGGAGYGLYGAYMYLTS